MAEIQAWRKGKFTTNAMDTLEPGLAFNGWTRGYDWNGWATPYFEAPEAARLMRAQTRLKLAEFKLRDGGCLYKETTGEDGWMVAQYVDGPDGVRLLPIGTMDWCWEEVKD